MKRLYINGKFCVQRVTGVQRVAGEVVRALDRQRIAAPESGPPPTLLVPPGAQPPALQAIDVCTVSGPASPAAWEQWALPRAASDGLLLSVAGSAPAFAAQQACFMHDAAIFDHPQAYAWSFRTWYRWRFRRLVRGPAMLFTVSEFSRNCLAVALGQPKARWHVLSPGADHLDAVQSDEAWFAAQGLKPGGYLLAVGSANPTKNHGRLCQAWTRLARGDTSSLVIVSGRARGVFAAERPVPAEGVLALGQASDAELKALYAHASGFIFPSLYEGFGLPPLEAMACGCPVAAAQAGSIPEVCGDAVLGFDPLDVDAIARAMARLLDDPTLREDLRRRGLARAAAYRWDRSAARLRAALRAEGVAV